MVSEAASQVPIFLQSLHSIYLSSWTDPITPHYYLIFDQLRILRTSHCCHRPSLSLFDNDPNLSLGYGDFPRRLLEDLNHCLLVLGWSSTQFQGSHYLEEILWCWMDQGFQGKLRVVHRDPIFNHELPLEEGWPKIWFRKGPGQSWQGMGRRVEEHGETRWLSNKGLARILWKLGFIALLSRDQI